MSTLSGWPGFRRGHPRGDVGITWHLEEPAKQGDAVPRFQAEPGDRGRYRLGDRGGGVVTFAQDLADQPANGLRVFVASNQIADRTGRTGDEQATMTLPLVWT